jgi:hypothetical protein
MTDPRPERVTHPTLLLPSALAPGENYASVERILLCDDLPQATLHIPHWRIDGRPAAIRVRALSLDEREIVQAQKTIADQYCRIWQYGCVQPSFTQEQAEALRRKNPYAVEQGAQFMLMLGNLDQEWIAHAVEARTAAPPAGSQEDAGAQPDTGKPDRVRRVA